MKKVLLSVALLGVTLSSSVNMQTTSGIYDTRPKNSFRGGSIKKGGKVKYPRR